MLILNEFRLYCINNAHIIYKKIQYFATSCREIGGISYATLSE
jgi:hypothetical protein